MHAKSKNGANWDWDFDRDSLSYDERLVEAGYIKRYTAFASYLDEVLREVWNSDRLERQLYGSADLLDAVRDPLHNVPRLPIDTR